VSWTAGGAALRRRVGWRHLCDTTADYVSRITDVKRLYTHHPFI